MAMRLFIGRSRQYDDNGKPEAAFSFVALDDDPDTDAPCGTPIGSYLLDELINQLIFLGRIKGRPTFEPPKIIECPGRSGFVDRFYEALSLDEIEYVRQRLRL